MINAGLLNEVYDIYHFNSDYTRGLRQAIGVREFEDFLQVYLSDGRGSEASDSLDKILKENMKIILQSPLTNQLKILLEEAIDKVKLNTRRLVRRQRRRIFRLQTLFGWKIHFIDVTEAISCMLEGRSEEFWNEQVVQPSVQCIRSFYDKNENLVSDAQRSSETEILRRDLWTQYICKACGDRILRGGHEWEQHKQGRAHRKRIARLRKSLSQGLVDEQQYLQTL